MDTNNGVTVERMGGRMDGRVSVEAPAGGSWTIRSTLGTPDDLSAVASLLEYGVAHGKVLPRTQEEIDYLIAEGHLYLAELEGQVVGMAALEMYSQRLAEVRSLVVFPSHQCQGIGSALVTTCVEEARRLGVREVLAVTDRIDFFYNLGFRDCLDGQVPLFIKLKGPGSG